MKQTTDNTRRQYCCEISDLAEGEFTVKVLAVDKDDAYEEAQIAAAERGCRYIESIEVIDAADEGASHA